MNRRAFLSLVGAGLTAAADPERLIWQPGRKLISIPNPPVFVSGAQIMHYYKQMDADFLRWQDSLRTMRLEAWRTMPWATIVRI